MGAAMATTTARGLLSLPPLPRLILTTASTASAPITATLATPTLLVLLSMARGLLKLLLIPTTDTMVDMDMDTVMAMVDTMAATAMATTSESKKDSKCQRMKTTTN